jgi:hypothetical protein
MIKARLKRKDIMLYRCFVIIMTFTFFSCPAMLLEYDFFVEPDYYFEEAPLYLSFYSNELFLIHRICENPGSKIEDKLIPQGVKVFFNRNYGCSLIREIRLNKEKMQALIVTCKNSVPEEYSEWDKVYEGKRCRCIISRR